MTCSPLTSNCTQASTIYLLSECVPCNLNSPTPLTLECDIAISVVYADTSFSPPFLRPEYDVIMMTSQSHVVRQRHIRNDDVTSRYFINTWWHHTSRAVWVNDDITLLGNVTKCLWYRNMALWRHHYDVIFGLKYDGENPTMVCLHYISKWYYVTLALNAWWTQYIGSTVVQKVWIKYHEAELLFAQLNNATRTHFSITH